MSELVVIIKTSDVWSMMEELLGWKRYYNLILPGKDMLWFRHPLSEFDAILSNGMSSVMGCRIG